MLCHALLTILMSGTAFCGLNLTILHNNDIHAHFDPVSASTTACHEPMRCYGGIGRLVYAARTFKERVPNTLMLYGGDIFQGHLYYTLFKWRVVADLMNLVPYDAMALGNHEFDDGFAGLLPYMRNVSHPLLCTNIDFGDLSTPTTAKCLSSIVRQIGGYSVGIMGYTTTDTPEMSSVPVGVTFLDEVEALQKETRRLQEQGVQIIIATGHSGYTREKQMAQLIDGVDIIVGGHSHSLLYTGAAPDGDPVDGPYPTVVRQPSGRTVLVVQAYQYGKYLGVLNVTFDDAGEVRSWTGNPIVLDGQQDPEALRHLQTYQARVTAAQEQMVGSTLVRLVGDRTVCRVQECNLGNLITDAMLRAVLTPGERQWSKVSAAICQGGGIRESMEPGNVSQADVQMVHPFGNTVDVALLSGHVLRQVFEHSVTRLGQGAGRFLQVSGLRVKYDVTQPVGSRVLQLEIVCTECTVPRLEPVLPHRHYRLAMPTFLVNGGDGYSVIKQNKLQHWALGELDADVLLDQIVRMSPVITGIEGRITFEVREVASSCISPSVAAILLVCSLVISKLFSV